MNRCETCLKYSTYSYSALFCIFGLVVVISSSVLLGNASYYDSHLNDESGYNSMRVGLVFSMLHGFLIISIGALGFTGTYFEKPELLLIFVISVLLVLVFELACGIYFVVNASVLERDLEFSVKKLFNQSRENAGARKYFTDTETNLKCCGCTSYKDYNEYEMKVPTSCCADGNYCKDIPNMYWASGCLEIIKKVYKKAHDIVIALSFLTVIVTAVGLAVSFGLTIVYIKKRNRI